LDKSPIFRSRQSSAIIGNIPENEPYELEHRSDGMFEVILVNIVVVHGKSSSHTQGQPEVEKSIPETRVVKDHICCREYPSDLVIIDDESSSTPDQSSYPADIIAQLEDGNWLGHKVIFDILKMFTTPGCQC
jgi:hypothetical protein